MRAKSVFYKVNHQNVGKYYTKATVMIIMSNRYPDFKIRTISKVICIVEHGCQLFAT